LVLLLGTVTRKYADYRNAGVVRPHSVSIVNTFADDHGQCRFLIYGRQYVSPLLGQLDVLFLNFVRCLENNPNGLIVTFS